MTTDRLMYGDYLVPGADPRVYAKITDMDKLRQVSQTSRVWDWPERWERYRQELAGGLREGPENARGKASKGRQCTLVGLAEDRPGNYPLSRPSLRVVVERCIPLGTWLRGHPTSLSVHADGSPLSSLLGHAGGGHGAHDARAGDDAAAVRARP